MEVKADDNFKWIDKRLGTFSIRGHRLIVQRAPAGHLEIRPNNWGRIGKQIEEILRRYTSHVLTEFRNAK